MKFLLDHNLPPVLARALNELSKPDNEVVPLSDKFDPTTLDVDWITQLAQEGSWAVITQDAAMRRNPQERRALVQNRVTAFCLTKGWRRYSLWDKAWRLVRWWPTIMEQAERLQRGVWYAVPVNFGRLRLEMR